MIKYFLTILIFSFSLCGGYAQSYDEYFTDQTLRLDYVFSGNAHTQTIALDQMSRLPQWAGRKTNLDKLLLDGNGQITVSDLASGKCIYRNSFSTLFQEWQTTDEAKLVRRSFENIFTIPYPKNKVTVDISLRDKLGVYKSAIKHIVDPEDILIKKKGFGQITPHTYIHRADSLHNSINIVIMAEGYTEPEMPRFYKQAEVACRQILAHYPFGKYADRLNFIAVESLSHDSGVSVPRAGIWKSTAFGSHFDTFYQDRYLTTTNVKDIHDALAGIPYQHIIILANTDVYGGGGIFNAYTLTTAGHNDFEPVVVHEFGHSFGGLADEYFYVGDLFDNTYNKAIEPWEPNITTLKNFSRKWKNSLQKSTPIPTPEKDAAKYPLGVYEGAGYSARGIYRPAIDCRMKTNTCKSFCPACQQAIERLILFYTEE